MTNTASARPRVLVTVPTFEPGFRGGGPVRSVASILDGTSADIDILLVTSDRDLGESRPYDGLSGRCVRRGNAAVRYVNVRSLGQLRRLLRDLRRERFDLLYLNSLWDPRFSIAVLIMAWLRVIPTRAVLVAPRGELGPGALHLKRTKKRLALAVIAPILTRIGVSWHACAELEAQDIRGQFPGANVVVSPNMTALPRQPIPPRSSDGILSVAFVSRISPKKNLVTVIAALCAVHATVKLDIYGPREDRRYWDECTTHIARCPANVTIRYCGELAPETVRTTFSRYDCFVFPTLGENFGHVIAESLSASCPVVCTDTTPWTDVIVAGGGVIVDGSVASLSEAIEDFARLTPADRYARRVAAGRAYVAWRAGQRDGSVLDLFFDHVVAGATHA